MVHLKRSRDGIPSIRATLVKHPQFKAPRTIVLQVDRRGVDILGKITPSFRELYEDVVRKLESGRGYANTLLDLGRKEAFRSLLEEAWGPEHAAMANANLATPIDSLNLTANVQNRKLIKLLEDRLNDYRRRL